MEMPQRTILWFHAVGNGHLPVLKALSEDRFPYCQINPDDLQALVLPATEKSHVAIVQHLFDLGVDPQSLGIKKEQLLNAACKF